MRRILMLLLVLLGLFFVPEVKAQGFKLRKEEQEGIYFVRKGGTVPDKSGIFVVYYLGGNLVYCLEPGKSIKTEDYVTSDGFVDLPYSDEIKEKMQLYGYYGREYPGHDDIRYSMAAQSLIWEAAGVETVTFWTGKNSTGEIIDVTAEKNEIKALVEKHHIIPNLPNVVQADVLHETIIEDKNNILDNFEVISDPYLDTYIENNKLHVTPQKPGLYSIRIKRKTYDDTNTIIFVGKNGTDTQTLGRLRFSNLNERDILIDVDGAHLYIHKTDENGNRINIPSINFKIKNLDTGEYLCDRYDCVFETDPTGLIYTNGVDFGDYEIEELEDQIIEGYSWNSEKLIISVTQDNVKWNQDILSYVEAEFKNNSVSGSLELHKKGEEVVFENNEVSYQETNLENIEFELYDSDNKLIENITIDNSGSAKVDNLDLGKYYLIEKNNDERYVSNVDKISFEIKQKDQYQTAVNYELTVNNYLKKGNLEFDKIDLNTGDGIPNTIIEIYNDENELLLTRETDELGKIKVSNLPLGKYYIIEKQANSMYQLTNEKVYFEILKDGEVVKARMTNEKIKVEVPKTDTKEDVIAHSIVGICLFIGLGGLLRERKKTI